MQNENYANPYDYIPFLTQTMHLHGGAWAVMSVKKDILDWKIQTRL